MRACASRPRRRRRPRRHSALNVGRPARPISQVSRCAAAQRHRPPRAAPARRCPTPCLAGPTDLAFQARRAQCRRRGHGGAAAVPGAALPGRRAAGGAGRAGRARPGGPHGGGAAQPARAPRRGRPRAARPGGAGGRTAFAPGRGRRTRGAARRRPGGGGHRPRRGGVQCAARRLGAAGAADPATPDRRARERPRPPPAGGTDAAGHRPGGRRHGAGRPPRGRRRAAGVGDDAQPAATRHRDRRPRFTRGPPAGAPTSARWPPPRPPWRAVWGA